MTQSDDKLELPHWSRLDNGYRFLYIFTSICFGTLIVGTVLYYNLISNIILTLGIGIIISGIIVVIAVDRLERSSKK